MSGLDQGCLMCAWRMSCPQDGIYTIGLFSLRSVLVRHCMVFHLLPFLYSATSSNCVNSVDLTPLLDSVLSTTSVVVQFRAVQALRMFSWPILDYGE